MRRQPLPEIICIDEKQWRHKGQNKYMCAILNFKTMEIVDIIDGRTKKAWSSYTQIIDKKELAKGQFRNDYPLQVQPPKYLKRDFY